MRRILTLSLFALALAACEKKPAPIESVESLVANPQRLKELREACKALALPPGWCPARRSSAPALRRGPWSVGQGSRSLVARPWPALVQRSRPVRAWRPAQRAARSAALRLQAVRPAHSPAARARPTKLGLRPRGIVACARPARAWPMSRAAAPGQSVIASPRAPRPCATAWRTSWPRRPRHQRLHRQRLPVLQRRPPRRPPGRSASNVTRASRTVRRLPPTRCAQATAAAAVPVPACGTTVKDS